MYDLLKEFIKPEFFILIPVLYLVGIGLKKSAVIDKHIPWMLGVIGIVLCVAYTMATLTVLSWQSVLLGAFTAVAQGILCAGASVYVDQLVKQGGKEE